MKACNPVLAILSLGLFVGCQTPQQPVQTMSISCNVPTITPVVGTKEAQEKGGIEIAVVPATYKTVRKTRVVTQQMQAPFAALVLAPQPQNKVYVRETVTPYLEPEPDRLTFMVRVNNKLSRVFRGQGAVVQVNVAGKMVPFGDLDYKEFINGIVPPRNEAEFAILALPLKAIPEKGTIGIFLYDVITATDTAGNVTEKQNFEWDFDYSIKPTEENGAVRSQEGFMDGAAFESKVRQQQLEAQRH